MPLRSREGIGEGALQWGRAEPYERGGGCAQIALSTQVGAALGRRGLQRTRMRTRCTHNHATRAAHTPRSHTQDVYKTAEHIRAHGGTITREPGPLPGINTKIMACTDPDGWKCVFVDEQDFNNELK